MESTSNLENVVSRYKPSRREWVPVYGLIESFRNYMGGRPSAIRDYDYNFCYILEQSIMTSAVFVSLGNLVERLL